MTTVSTTWVGGPPQPVRVANPSHCDLVQVSKSGKSAPAAADAPAAEVRLAIETVQLLDWLRAQERPASCRAAAEHLKESPTTVLARLRTLHRGGYVIRYESIGNLPVVWSAVPELGQVHAKPGKEWSTVLTQIRTLWDRAPGRSALPELQNLQREINLLIQAI